MGKRGRGQSTLKRRLPTRRSERIRKKEVGESSKEEIKRQKRDTSDRCAFVPGFNDILVDAQCNMVRVKTDEEGEVRVKMDEEGEVRVKTDEEGEEDSGTSVKQEGEDSDTAVKQEGEDSGVNGMEGVVNQSVKGRAELSEIKNEALVEKDEGPLVVVKEEVIFENCDPEETLLGQRNAIEAGVDFNKRQAELRKNLQGKDLRIANLRERRLEDGAKSSRVADETLEESKVLSLFEEVLKLIVQQEKTPEGYINWKKHWSVLTSCRLLCKSWKRSVDSLLEAHPSHLALPKDSLRLVEYKENYSPSPASFDFHLFLRSQEYKNMEVFVFKRQQEICPSYNPIPTRHLKIRFPSFPINMYSVKGNLFTQHVSNYLESFGSEIWYLTLCRASNFPNEDRIQTWKCLLKWLHLLPNLKCVAFDLPSVYADTLEDNLEEFSFPHWNKVVTFQFKCDSVFVYNMLSSNKHLQKVDLSATAYNDCPLSSILEMDFPNLSEIAITISKKEDLEKLATVSWKLRSLKLSVSLRKVQECSTQRVVDVFKRFKNTLESLTLSLPNCKMDGMLGDTALNLPRLKHLRIRCHQEWETGRLENLLSYLSNLETLEISIVEQLAREDWRSVDFNSVREPSYWSNFLQLKRVSITVSVNEWVSPRRRRGIICVNWRYHQFQYFLRGQDVPKFHFDLKLITYPCLC